jgi:2-haloacid dehalogenase
MIYFRLKKLEYTNQSSKVYELPINKYKIQKNEVAFLSSNTWDVSGGGNYGYKSIWVNRNKNIFDNLDFKPEYEIKSLIELKSILKKD